MIAIHSKLPNLGTTIFTTMTQLANQYQAINLAQGFPNMEVDKHLTKAVAKAMQSGANQYAPMAGYLPLKEHIAEHVAAKYNANYHPEHEITITAGATQAIFTAIATFVHPADEVIVFEPAYDCYAPAIKLMGGVVKAFELSAPNYQIDWELVKKLFTANTKMIIINSPHNPTGRILTEEDVQALIKLTRGTDIILLSDEVYADIIYDQKKHLSLAQYPELATRSLLVYSYGKLLSVTGWKIGYVLAPANLSAEFRKVHQYNVFSVNTPMQVGIQQFLKNSSIYEEIGSFFEEKRNLFSKLMQNSPFELLPCQGAYFQCMSYKNISTQNDREFAIQLTKKSGVAAIPLSAFYTKAKDQHILRFCFAKDDQTLKQAAEKLCLIPA